MIRNRILLGHKNFHFFRGQFIQDVSEELSSFILQYYLNTQEVIPGRIVTPSNYVEDKALEAALKSELAEDIRVGYSPKFDSILQLTFENAQETQNVRMKNQESAYFGLKRLKELLCMNDIPNRLECYDIAVWQGKSPTASQIVFENGRPVKSDYRHYNLEERPEGNNDFAMIEETLARRLKKGNHPDVIVIDGGKGQVSSVLKVLEELGLDIPVCGIAKSKNKDEVKTEERLIIPGRANPYLLKKNMSLMRIIVSMRDEAHRFSRRLHHHKEKERVLSGWLDLVDDVGIKTKEKIRKNLSYSKNELILMTPEQLMACMGVSKRVANKIWEHFKRTRE